MGNGKNARSPMGGGKGDSKKVVFGNRAYWRSMGETQPAVGAVSEMRDKPTEEGLKAAKMRMVGKGFTMVADSAAQAASFLPGPAGLIGNAYMAFAPEGSRFHSTAPIWQKAVGMGVGILGGKIINGVASKLAGKIGQSATAASKLAKPTVAMRLPDHPLGALGNLPVGKALRPPVGGVDKMSEVVFRFPDAAASTVSAGGATVTAAQRAAAGGNTNAAAVMNALRGAAPPVRAAPVRARAADGAMDIFSGLSGRPRVNSITVPSGPAVATSTVPRGGPAARLAY
jgi:hypothetical protein